MDIKFSCNECGQTLIAKAEHAGREAECPKCQHTLIIPQPLPKDRKVLLAKEWTIELGSIWIVSRSPLVSLETIRNWIICRKIKKDTLIFRDGVAEGRPASQIPELVDAFSNQWPLYKAWPSQHPILLIFIVATIALSAHFYYSNYLKIVPIQTGERVICRRCGDIQEEKISIVQRRAKDRARYPLKIKKVLCQYCVAKVAQRDATLASVARNLAILGAVALFIFLMCRYPKFRKAIGYITLIGIVLAFLASLASSKKTCRHCGEPVPADTTICKHCTKSFP